MTVTVAQCYDARCTSVHRSTRSLGQNCRATARHLVRWGPEPAWTARPADFVRKVWAVHALGTPTGDSSRSADSSASSATVTAPGLTPVAPTAKLLIYEQLFICHS